MTNWKTTTLGILTILGGVTNAAIAYFNGKQVDLPTLFAAITAGWGLIHASDAAPSAIPVVSKEQK